MKTSKAKRSNIRRIFSRRSPIARNPWLILNMELFNFSGGLSQLLARQLHMANPNGEIPVGSYAEVHLPTAPERGNSTIQWPRCSLRYRTLSKELT